MKKSITFVSLLLVLILACTVTALAEEWICEKCQTHNTGNFCTNCGAEKPSSHWVCPACGTENEGKFCSNCGAKKPSPGEEPAPENAGTISGIKCSTSGGITTISWKDSAKKGPYTVYFSAPEWEDFRTTYGEEDISKTSISGGYLIPGETYIITVTNGTSSDSVEYTTPKSTFTEFKSSRPLTMDHTSFDLSGDNYYSTFRIDLNYPRLSKARTYAWVLALKTPKGYCSFVRYNETFELEKRWSGYYWNLAINEYMDAVKNNFGEIPNGEYSFECYFDGRIYGSVPFKVFKLD